MNAAAAGGGSHRAARPSRRFASRLSAGWSGCVICAASLFATPATAHNPDTSYARFQVSGGDLQASFTYDLVTLNRLVPGIDADQDHRITRDELLRHAPAVYALLRQHIRLAIDEQDAAWGDELPLDWPPDAGDAVAEADYHTVQALMTFGFVNHRDQPIADFWVEFDFFEQVGQRHSVLGAIEHHGREEEVIFNRAWPNYLYDTGYQPPIPTPAVATRPPTADTLPPPTERRERSNTNTSVWSQLSLFFQLGVEHIFIGYDHILFLLALILVSRFWDLLKVVTSFTVAHTITLMLATLQMVTLPGRLVETAIAATIVYAGLENAWIKRTDRRWRLTFAFGLIHGFGFAGVLRELGLPTTGLVRCLISFNVGVEAGQLAIVLLLWLPVAAVGRWRHGRRLKLAISGVVVLCGLGWFLDRACGLSLMPF